MNVDWGSIQGLGRVGLVLLRDVEAHLLHLQVAALPLLLDGVVGGHGAGHLNLLPFL